MRTILFRTMLAGLTVFAIATAAGAEDRSNLLTSPAGVIARTPATAQTRSNVSKTTLSITLSQPTSLKAGENQFDVVVKTADGQPISDAVVSVTLSTARIPAQGWLWKEVKLTPSGNGTYAGSGALPKAPKWVKWETTIRVRKDGKKIGQKKVTLVAA